MGKYYDQLKTGDPNRKVTNQEILNVMGEYLEEATEMLRKSSDRIFEAPKPPPTLKQRLLRAIRRHRPVVDAPKKKGNL